MVSFDPFLSLEGPKTLENRSNDPLGPIFGSFYLLWAFLAIFPFSDIFGDFFTY
jgi:hypothetical protein